MNVRKFNFHCHSNFSDGSNDIKTIVETYKFNDFECAVITDHVYSSDNFTRFNINSTDEYLKQLEQSKSISKELQIPVICGIELSCYQYSEEIVVIGEEACKFILKERDKYFKLENGRSPNEKILTEAIDKFECFTILAHPHLLYFDEFKIDLAKLNGTEIINACQNYFPEGRRNVPEEIDHLKKFCNSDAHQIKSIDKCYNLIKCDSIKDEHDLIKMLKSDIKIDHYNKYFRINND